MHPAARPIVILVVDDEPIVRMYAVDSLEDAGFIVVEAGDAEEALSLLDARPDIAVLFTDINMPGPMDGLDLARRVHAIRPDVQLIVTSGRIRPSNDELPDCGAFVPKPYSASEVVSLVRAASH